MNISRTSGLLLLLLFSILLTPAPATARVLQCKVVEIESGDTLSVINGSGPMRVRLKAVDAPEMDQPWGETARQHLSDLVLGKVVTVELTGLSEDVNIVGIVYLDKTDIGQQMIRDGVAWYDQSKNSGLGELARQLYVQSEQAARAERRGLWQDEQPMSPWEFRQAKVKQAETAAQSKWAKPSSPTISKSPPKSTPPPPSTANWQRFAPAGEEFSILLPPVSVESPKKLPQGMLSVYVAQSDGLIYDILKCVIPEGESAESLFNNLMLFQEFFHKASREHGISADIYPQHDLPPLNGYQGKQYEIFYGSQHGLARVYIGRRYLYTFTVAGGYEGDPRVDQFLSSFTFNKGANRAATGGKQAR